CAPPCLRSAGLGRRRDARSASGRGGGRRHLRTPYLTTRGPVRRLGRLASSSARIADGNLRLAVPAGPPDEVGRLERQFNTMAARLEEARKSRDGWPRRPLVPANVHASPASCTTPSPRTSSRWRCWPVGWSQPSLM